jgi:hypothetical protein
MHKKPFIVDFKEFEAEKCHLFNCTNPETAWKHLLKPRVTMALSEESTL